MLILFFRFGSQVAETLKEEEMAKSSAWLDLVFALLTLNKAQQHHLTSTIKPEFIDKLLSLGGKMKENKFIPFDDLLA